MNTRDLVPTLTTLFSELVGGAPQESYVLNRGDLGLFRSLDRHGKQKAGELSPPGSRQPRK